ncbi:hypothetical protein K505DRAFT_389929 [Melanomma pulvis-pyrius CBS 109.77]|uniref:HTH psq-type domain-containing protein n=1 Tax=Melanomma pulvis-pyrius CBS 109.77 TaxID=1314802 RepID=A0A6A6X3U7_9PLEO|nr:hypothetical protein K505DRAFT_389929 [Melanomma pulvis-pyrius CBS 109.77]
MDSREAAIELAILAFNARIFSTVSAAARAYSIPRETLRDRLNGATNSNTSH